MGRITLRIDDDKMSAIDALALAAGMSRSAWVNRAITDALQARPEEIRDVPIGEGVSRMLSVRLPIEEIAAIEMVAAKAGITRGQWIKRTIRWQLWSRAGELRLIPSSYRSILKLVSQTRALGRSLNQAVKAMNAANRPDSTIEIMSGARAVIELEGRLSDQLNANASTLGEIVSGEVKYWTGKARRTSKSKAVEL